MSAAMPTLTVHVGKRSALAREAPMNPIDNPQTTRGASTVVGLFRDNTQAERAIRDLKTAGFSDRQIGVIMQDRDEQRRLAADTGTKVEETAAAGAVGGGVLGGLVGLLAGVGAL